MDAPLVDKAWRTRGLAPYSTAQILGTLAHYGVATDEAAFASLAATTDPPAIITAWTRGWTAKGAFSSFHSDAAEELFRRLSPRVLPDDWAEAVGDVVSTLLEENELPDPPTLAIFDALLTRAPPATFDAGRAELADEWSTRSLRQAAHLAAQKGATDLAMRLCAIDESLFPATAGISRAFARSHGDQQAGLTALLDLGKDPCRPLAVRREALDALIDAHAGPEMLPAFHALLADADRAADFKAAVGIAENLADAYRLLSGELVCPDCAEVHRHAH